MEKEKLIERILKANDRFAGLSQEVRKDVLADILDVSFRNDDHFNSYLERKEKTFGELKVDDKTEQKGTSPEEMEQIFKNLRI